MTFEFTLAKEIFNTVSVKNLIERICMLIKKVMPHSSH